MTHPNAPSTERLRSKLSQQLRNLAEGTDSGTVTLTKVGGQILRDAATSLDALTQENARLREALRTARGILVKGGWLPKGLTEIDRALNGGTSDAE